jgi:hypothetical protein
MLRAMMTSVPMWIPTLIYGIGVVIMMLVQWRDSRRHATEYQRGYDAGCADTVGARIRIDAVRIGPASTEMTLTHWIEVEVDDETPVH